LREQQLQHRRLLAELACVVQQVGCRTLSAVEMFSNLYYIYVLETNVIENWKRSPFALTMVR
jgi:hypothetical protein